MAAAFPSPPHSALHVEKHLCVFTSLQMDLCSGSSLLPKPMPRACSWELGSSDGRLPGLWLQQTRPSPGVLVPHRSSHHHTHVCTHTRTQGCTLYRYIVHVHAHVNARMHTRTGTLYMCTHTHMDRDMPTTHTCTHVPACAHTDVHECTCTHSCTQPVLTHQPTQPWCTGSSQPWLPPHLHWPHSHCHLSFSSEASPLLNVCRLLKCRGLSFLGSG